MSKTANDARDSSSSSASLAKKQNRCRSFHFRYLELCRSKNVTPLPEIKSKNNSPTSLELYGDKISVNDWLLIVEALFYDQVLQTLVIRTRKSWGVVIEHLDSEKKAKLFRQKPVLYTKYVFSGICEAIANCVAYNTNLRVLNLEGLPLADSFMDSIAKAMASNESLRDVSFQRSNIYDKGCETICSTIKYLENIEQINLSECGLTNKSAEAVADMIKMQKISRYTEGWQKSLRYREVDPNSLPGLRFVALSRNPQIDDDGVKVICEVLKEDVWIKVIEMENCGLTDRGANYILDCLEANNHINDFNVNGNTGISKFLQRTIHDQLGKEDEEQKAFEEHQQLINGLTTASLANKKVTMSQLKDRLKTLEEQLAFERVLRKKAEQLNERLNQQIIAYESQLEEAANANIPEGYVVVKNESLQSIIQEHKELLEITNQQSCEANEIKEKQMNTARTLRHDRVLIAEPEPTDVSSMKLYDELAGEEIDEQRKFTLVRKVKSEIKYAEPPAKVALQKKEAKSDHEFCSEAEFEHFSQMLYENNIGDSLINNAQITQRSSPRTHRVEKKSVRNSGGSGGGGDGDGSAGGAGGAGGGKGGDVNGADGYKHSNNYIGNFSPNQQHMMYPPDSDVITMANNFDMDELMIETTRSLLSNECGSTDSDTIRNSMEKQSMQVFIKPKAVKKKTKTAKQKQKNEQDDATQMDMLESLKQSPRSLFFGLTDD